MLEQLKDFKKRERSTIIDDVHKAILSGGDTLLGGGDADNITQEYRYKKVFDALKHVGYSVDEQDLKKALDAYPLDASSATITGSTFTGAKIIGSTFLGYTEKLAKEHREKLKPDAISIDPSEKTLPSSDNEKMTKELREKIILDALIYGGYQINETAVRKALEGYPNDLYEAITPNDNEETIKGKIVQEHLEKSRLETLKLAGQGDEPAIKKLLDADPAETIKRLRETYSNYKNDELKVGKIGGP